MKKSSQMKIHSKYCSKRSDDEVISIRKANVIYEKDDICHHCLKKGDNLVACTGYCNRVFHLECISNRFHKIRIVVS